MYIVDLFVAFVLESYSCLLLQKIILCGPKWCWNYFWENIENYLMNGSHKTTFLFRVFSYNYVHNNFPHGYTIYQLEQKKLILI